MCVLGHASGSGGGVARAAGAAVSATTGLGRLLTAILRLLDSSPRALSCERTPVRASEDTRAPCVHTRSPRCCFLEKGSRRPGRLGASMQLSRGSVDCTCHAPLVRTYPHLSGPSTRAREGLQRLPASVHCRGFGWRQASALSAGVPRHDVLERRPNRTGATRRGRRGTGRGRRARGGSKLAPCAGAGGCASGVKVALVENCRHRCRRALHRHDCRRGSLHIVPVRNGGAPGAAPWRQHKRP